MPAGRHARPADYPRGLGALTVAVLVLVSGAATVHALAEPANDGRAQAVTGRTDPEPRASRSYRPTPAPKHHRASTAPTLPTSPGQGRGPSSSPQPAPRKVLQPAATRLNPDRAIVVAWALTQLGKPYAWGGAGPDTYDCSGLVLAAFAHAGYAMPRWSGDQHRMGPAVPVDQLDAGDLVAWPGHVAIYLGRGRVVEAALPGTQVRVRRLGNAFDATAWGVTLDYSRLPPR